MAKKKLKIEVSFSEPDYSDLTSTDCGVGVRFKASNGKELCINLERDSDDADDIEDIPEGTLAFYREANRQFLDSGPIKGSNVASLLQWLLAD